jgi:putative ABC transport system permease protein
MRSGEEGSERAGTMIPVRYNLRSLIVRRVGTVMTIIGVALTVAVFVTVLSMVQGLEGTFLETGEPLNLIMIRQASQAETNSFFDRDIKPIVETTEGVTAAAGEIIVLINHPRATGETANVIVRGVSEKSLELRPRLKVVEGRMFRPGLREIIVSRSISKRFRGAKIGDSIKIGRSGWAVVGILDAARTAYDSEIWADYNELSGEFERPIYSSLLVRAADDASMTRIRERLAGDRRIQLDVFGQGEYFEAQAGSALPIKVLGYLIASIMAIGSSFAVMNTMYAATSYRTREIATLRVLGFRRRNIMLSFMFESLLLALLGGALGCVLALPMNGISTGTSNMTTFSEVVFDFRVTPQLMLQGLIFAAVMGTLGGFLPARLASRLTIVKALRTEV